MDSWVSWTIDEVRAELSTITEDSVILELVLKSYIHIFSESP